MKICTTCGSNHADDVDFCPYDGTPLFASASMEDDGLPEPDFSQGGHAGNKRMDSSQFPEVEPLLFAQPQPRVAPRLDSAEFPEVEPTRSVNSMPAVELPQAAPEPARLAPEPAPVASEPARPAPLSPEPARAAPSSLEPARLAPMPAPMASGSMGEEDEEDAFDPGAPTPPPRPAVVAPASPSVLDLLGDPIPAEEHALDSLAGEEPLSLEDGLKSRVAPMPEPPPEPPKKSSKLWVGLAVAAVLLAVLGAVGYFVVLPMLNKGP